MSEKGLTPKQMKAIEIMVRVAPAGATKEEIATTIGVSRKTLWEWEQKPEFRSALEDAYALLWRDAAKEAMKVMVKLAVKDQDRQAAAYILDSAGYSAPQKVELTSADIRIAVGDDD